MLPWKASEMSRPSTSKSSLVAAAMLVACAAPAPTLISPGVYIVSRTSASGSVFANMAQLKADTIVAANTFAESKGKIAVPVSIRDERPVPGFPLVEYQFRLAEPGTVKDSSIVLEKGPDTVVKRDDNLTIKDNRQQPEAKKDIYSELIKLEDLKKRGLITEAEFQSLKKRILDSQ